MRVVVAVGGFSHDQLVAQVVGVAVIAGWTVAATYVVFAAFRAVGQARVAPDHEREGLDGPEHGVDTYPEFGDREPLAAAGLGGLRTDGSGGRSGRRADGGAHGSARRPDGGVPTETDSGIDLVTASSVPTG